MNTCWLVIFNTQKEKNKNEKKKKNDVYKQKSDVHSAHLITLHPFSLMQLIIKFYLNTKK